MGDFLKGVHFLSLDEYITAVENEQIDDDVIYVTPEDVTEIVRQHTVQINKNTEDIAKNTSDIASLKNNSSGGQTVDLTEIKNTINEIILRDINQDSRLDNIETNYAKKSETVTLSDAQTITGPKTFTEHIYLANADGTVDRISHLNNNFIIHSGATNSAVLNIDEGLEKIYAFNEELAFKSDIAESSGTTIYVDGTTVASLSFSTDPQTQINLLATSIDDNIASKVSKAGDTMTGELIASGGMKFGNNKIKSENSGNSLRTYHVENNKEYDILNYTHGGILTVNNVETPLILQGYDDRPTYVSGSGIMSVLALESDITTAISGLGTVFNLKGTKETLSELPSVENSIGDVWYVSSEQVGYIWLNDGTEDRWERFGAPIELGGYATTDELKIVSDKTDALETVVNNIDLDAIAFAEEELLKNQNLTEFYEHPEDTNTKVFYSVGNNIKFKQNGQNYLLYSYNPETTELTLGKGSGTPNTHIRIEGLKPNTQYEVGFNLVKAPAAIVRFFGYYLDQNREVNRRYWTYITSNSNGVYESYDFINSGLYFDSSGPEFTISHFKLKEGSGYSEYTPWCGVDVRTKTPRVSADGVTSFGNDVVVEYWIASDGLSWYRKWASGWKECGIRTNATTSWVNKTLPITFSNTNYTISIAKNQYATTIGTSAVSTSQIDVRASSDIASPFVHITCEGF